GAAQAAEAAVRDPPEEAGDRAGALRRGVRRGLGGGGGGGPGRARRGVRGGRGRRGGAGAAASAARGAGPHRGSVEQQERDERQTEYEQESSCSHVRLLSHSSPAG